MKLLCHAIFILSVFVLGALTVGMVARLIEQQVPVYEFFADPIFFLYCAYYACVGRIGLNFDWFGCYGPLLMLALLNLLVITSSVGCRRCQRPSLD